MSQSTKTTNPPFEDDIKLALRLFLQDALHYDKRFQEPFRQGDWIFATNGYVMIAVPSCYFQNPEEDYSIQLTPNTLGMIELQDNMSVDFELSFLHSKIAEAKGIFDEKFKTEVVNCPDCDGDEVVTFTFTDHKGMEHELDDACPCCDPGGKVETIIDLAKNKPFGGRVFQTIEFNGTFFKKELFVKLCQVAELLHEKTISLVCHVEGWQAFKFRIGPAYVFLAPMRSPVIDTPYDIQLNVSVTS